MQFRRIEASKDIAATLAGVRFSSFLADWAKLMLILVLCARRVGTLPTSPEVVTSCCRCLRSSKSGRRREEEEGGPGSRGMYSTTRARGGRSGRQQHLFSHKSSSAQRANCG